MWECLDSVYNQTFPKENYEVLVILNGCREPYEASINEYISAHPDLRCRLIQTDVGGVSNARNMGIDESKGEYIAFLDDDDYVSPSYLEELYAKADKDTIALCRPVAFMDGSNRVVPDFRISREFSRYSVSGKQAFYGPKKFYSGPCMKLIHRDIIGARRFDTGFKNGEDSLFMFLISDRIKWCDFTSEKAIYYRRFREGSANLSQRRWDKLRNSARLAGAYTKVYVKGFPHYVLVFYLTRILASIKRVIC